MSDLLAKTPKPKQEKRWWNRGHRNHLPLMNTKNIHLHVEQFSLKINWKLSKRCLYNQSCRKGIHVIRLEGKKSNQVGICVSGMGLEGKGDVQVDTCPGEEQWQPQIWMPQSWGPTWGRQAPWLFGRWLGLTGGLWGSCTLLLWSSQAICPWCRVVRGDTGLLWRLWISPDPLDSKPQP